MLFIRLHLNLRQITSATPLIPVLSYHAFPVISPNSPSISRSSSGVKDDDIPPGRQGWPWTDMGQRRNRPSLRRRWRSSLFVSKLLTVVIFSIALGLGIEKSVLVASARCLIQLTLMVHRSVADLTQGMVLDTVFSSRNPFFIFALVFLLVFLGAFEICYNRAKRRFDGMVFPARRKVSLCSFWLSCLACRVLWFSSVFLAFALPWVKFPSGSQRNSYLSSECCWETPFLESH